MEMLHLKKMGYQWNGAKIRVLSKKQTNNRAVGV